MLFNNFMPTYLSYLNFGTVTRLARKAAVSTLWTNWLRKKKACCLKDKVGDKNKIMWRKVYLFVAVKKPTNKPRSAALNPEFQSTFKCHQNDFNLACVSKL